MPTGELKPLIITIHTEFHVCIRKLRTTHIKYKKTDCFFFVHVVE